MRRPYRTAPDDDDRGWPRGLPFIVANEACERFSFYGMRAILKVYLLSLYTQQGLTDEAARSASTAATHFFNSAVYALPLLGGLAADRWLGKYRIIVSLSLAYCAGHAVLSLTEGSLGGTYAGLALIAIGAGGIKPCVSAHLGDQFGRSNRSKLEKAYDIFYFSINFGSFFSSLLIPWLKQRYGWSVAFALPGILMAIATGAFWLGRHRFVHVPPRRGSTPLTPDERAAVLRLIQLFALISVFWALWDQYASSWVDQGSMMRTDFWLPGVGAVHVLPEQLQALNPVLVMLMIPLMGWGVYPGLQKLGIAMPPLRRIAVGMFLCGLSFVSAALLQERIDAGSALHIGWQMVSYVLLTLAEVMVSITGLEFAYSQAPARMKSTIMSLWLLTTAVGNLLTGLLAAFGGLGLAQFFWIFAVLSGLAGLAFTWQARRYFAAAGA